MFRRRDSAAHVVLEGGTILTALTAAVVLNGVTPALAQPAHPQAPSLPAPAEPLASAPGPEQSPASSDAPVAPETKTDAARLEELEKRVAEQERRIEELTLPRQGAVPGEHAAVASAATPPPTRATPNAEKEGVQELRHADPLAAFTANDFPKSVPLFGSDFRFALGGYIKVDALYDFNGIGNRTSFSLESIAVGDADQQAGYFYMQARESRLNFDVRYSAKGAPNNQAFVEFDFFTPPSAGFVGPRLRHAYLRWGDFLAGQTWSLLTDMRPLPFIIDFAFADSVNAGRVPQFRYQAQWQPWLYVRAGIEMPESTGVDNPFLQTGAVNPRLPRAAVGASIELPRGFVSAGASFSELRWDGGTTAPSASALSWSAVLNGRVFLDKSRRIFLGAHGSVGQGNAETVGTFAGQNSNAELLQDGSLEAIRNYRGVVSYGHRWLDSISTNFAFAFGVLAPPSVRSEDAMSQNWSIHGNVVYHVALPVQLGVEYMAGQRTNGSGESGTAQRIESMVMYSF